MKPWLIISMVTLAGLFGCEKPSENTKPFDWNKYPVAASSQPQSGPFTLFTSNDGTFLLDTSKGKVWRFSQKDSAFLETVVTSNIMTYNSKTQKLEPDNTSGTNPSGKPCDKKTDPLCIR